MRRDAPRRRRITWFNLPLWAFRTAAASWLTYQVSGRGFRWSRVWSAWRPCLDDPIFVLGAPRSGTTFLGACLGGLEEVSYHFEPVATKAAASQVYLGLWSERRACRFYRGVYRWLMRLHADGDLRFAEKTPRNAFIMAFLGRAFPGARFVHIVRDGRDVALSLSQRPWLQDSQRGGGRFEPGGYPYGPYARFWVEAERIEEFETTSDLHRAIWSWRRHTEAALEGTEELPAGHCHLVRYESLVRAPEREADRLLDFLGVTGQRARQRLHAAARRARRTSVGQWRRELSPAALQVIDRESGGLLERLGYEDG